MSKQQNHICQFYDTEEQAKADIATQAPLYYACRLHMGKIEEQIFVVRTTKAKDGLFIDDSNRYFHVYETREAAQNFINSEEVKQAQESFAVAQEDSYKAEATASNLDDIRDSQIETEKKNGVWNPQTLSAYSSLPSDWTRPKEDPALAAQNFEPSQEFLDYIKEYRINNLIDGSYRRSLERLLPEKIRNSKIFIVARGKATFGAWKDQTKWKTFSEAMAIAEKVAKSRQWPDVDQKPVEGGFFYLSRKGDHTESNLPGIGIFSRIKENPILVFDFDKAFDGNGKIKPRPSKFLEVLQRTSLGIEISHSRMGLHVYVQALNIPTNFFLADYTDNTSPDHIEVYCASQSQGKHLIVFGDAYQYPELDTTGCLIDETEYIKGVRDTLEQLYSSRQQEELFFTGYSTSLTTDTSSLVRHSDNISTASSSWQKKDYIEVRPDTLPSIMASYDWTKYDKQEFEDRLIAAIHKSIESKLTTLSNTPEGERNTRGNELAPIIIAESKYGFNSELYYVNQIQEALKKSGQSDKEIKDPLKMWIQYSHDHNYQPAHKITPPRILSSQSTERIVGEDGGQQALEQCTSPASNDTCKTNLWDSVSKYAHKLRVLLVNKEQEEALLKRFPEVQNTFHGVVDDSGQETGDIAYIFDYFEGYPRGLSGTWLTKGKLQEDRPLTVTCAPEAGTKALVFPECEKDKLPPKRGALSNDYEKACDMEGLQLVTASTSQYTDFPDFIYHPDGLIGEICEYIKNTARKYNPIYATAGAISLISALLLHRVKTPSNILSNTYVVIIGNSGSGKNDPIKAISKILQASKIALLKKDSDYGFSLRVNDTMASGESVLSSLRSSRRVLFTLDEVGALLDLAKNPNGNLKQVSKVMLEWFSHGEGPYLKTYTDEKKNLFIPWGSFSFFGTTTPQQIWDALSIKDTQDGLVARTLFFEDIEQSSRKHGHMCRQGNTIPGSLINKVKDIWAIDDRMPKAPSIKNENLFDFSDMEEKKRLGEWDNYINAYENAVPELQTIPVYGEAKDYYYAEEQRLYDIEESIKNDEPAKISQWARVFEQGMKLATIYAFSKRSPSKVLKDGYTVEDLQRGFTLAQVLCERTLQREGVYVHDSEFDEYCQKLLRRIPEYLKTKRAQERGHKVGAPLAFIHQTLKLPSRQVEEVIKALIDQDKLRAVPQRKANGHEYLVYAVVTGDGGE